MKVLQAALEKESGSHFVISASAHPYSHPGPRHRSSGQEAQEGVEAHLRFVVLLPDVVLLLQFPVKS